MQRRPVTYRAVCLLCGWDQDGPSVRGVARCPHCGGRSVLVDGEGVRPRRPVEPAEWPPSKSGRPTNAERERRRLAPARLPGGR